MNITLDADILFNATNEHRTNTLLHHLVNDMHSLFVPFDRAWRGDVSIDAR